MIEAPLYQEIVAESQREGETRGKRETILDFLVGRAACPCVDAVNADEGSVEVEPGEAGLRERPGQLVGLAAGQARPEAGQLGGLGQGS